MRRLSERLEEWAAVALLVLIFLVLTIQVVGRFVLQNPPVWSEELARYLFVWMVFIGAADAVRTRTHIAMTLIPDLLPERLRLSLGLILDALILGSLAIVVIYGWGGTLRAHRVESITLGAPESFLYGAAPFGAALMALRLILRMARDAGALASGRSAAEADPRPVREGSL